MLNIKTIRKVLLLFQNLMNRIIIKQQSLNNKIKMVQVFHRINIHIFQKMMAINKTAF